MHKTNKRRISKQICAIAYRVAPCASCLNGQKMRYPGLDGRAHLYHSQIRTLELGPLQFDSLHNLFDRQHASSLAVRMHLQYHAAGIQYCQA